MRYVAIYHNTLFSCWPEQAEEEYISLYGKKAFESLDRGEEALWLGAWLVDHKNEFQVRSEDDYSDDFPREKGNDDMVRGKIYSMFENENIFYWLDEDGDVSTVIVEEVPDDTLWTIIEDSEYGCEMLCKYHKPDRNGYLKYKLS